jgi:mono/diheme cytochrome c family protein
MKRVALAVAALAAAAGLAGAGVVASGLYDVSATDQHLAPTYHLLDFAVRRAIKWRAAAIAVPPLDETAIAHGVTLYRDHCLQCHGAPGVAPEPFALGLLPAPSNLAHPAREWPAAEIYWVVRNGLKMTGMPAWRFRLSDAELWALVAFVKKLPELSPTDYRALAAGPKPRRAEAARAHAAANAQRGRTALLQYACVTCHRIPGVVGANAPVGPPLDGFATRSFIAGVLRNEPEQLMRWLRSPHEVAPASAMPDLGVSEQDALDIAAYLATLK